MATTTTRTTMRLPGPVDRTSARTSAPPSRSRCTGFAKAQRWADEAETENAMTPTHVS